MGRLCRILLICAFVTVFAALGSARAENSAPLTLFAAASMGEALRAALDDFPHPTRLSLGGSGAIARQVDQGAPADAVMLAHPAWTDWLQERGRLLQDTRISPLGNRLILVAPPGTPPLEAATRDTLTQRLGATGRLAIGEHRSVPAGQYAKTWLETAGLWTTLAPRLAEVENVRAALALVSRGEVPLAIIYASDLVAAPDAAALVWTPPNTEQPDIQYDLAATTDAGRALVDHLTTPAALATFAQFGFTHRDAP